MKQEFSLSDQMMLLQSYKFSSIVIRVLVLMVMWIVLGCSEESVRTRSYPVIDTHSVTEINQNGAILNAELIDLGSDGVIEHGFVYGDFPEPLLERSDRILLGEPLQKGPYSVLASNNLIDGKTYYVKAFAISKGKGITVYGQETSFVSQGGSAPTISGFSPVQGVIGDTIIISGTGFSTIHFNNRVRFGTVGAPVVKSKNDSIWCIVPLFGVPGENQLSVEVGQFKVEAEANFTLNPLTLLSLAPNPVSFGDTITIKGNYLPVRKEFIKVMLLDKEALIHTLKYTEMKVIVPGNATQHKSLVNIVAGEQVVTYPDSIRLLPPVINNFSPQEGTKGTEITIHGNYFSSIKENIKVEINGVKCTVTEASRKLIKVIIPSGITPGEYPISLTIANQNKVSFENFEIIQPSITDVNSLSLNSTMLWPPLLALPLQPNSEHLKDFWEFDPSKL